MSSSAVTPSETATFDALKASATFVPPVPKAVAGGGGGGSSASAAGEKPDTKKGAKKDKDPSSNEADTRVADAGLDLADEERIEPINPKDVKLDNFCGDFEFAGKWTEGKMKGFYTRKLTVNKQPFALRFVAQLMFTPDFEETGQYAKPGQSLTTQWRIPAEYVKGILDYIDAYLQHVGPQMSVTGKKYTPLVKLGGYKDKTIKKRVEEGNFQLTGKEERHDSILEIELPRARKPEDEPLKRSYFVPILDPQNKPLLVSEIPNVLVAGRKFLIDVEFPHTWKNAERWGMKKQLAMVRQEPYVSTRTVTKAPAPAEIRKRKNLNPSESAPAQAPPTTAPPPISAPSVSTPPPPPAQAPSAAPPVVPPVGA